MSSVFHRTFQHLTAANVVLHGPHPLVPAPNNPLLTVTSQTQDYCFVCSTSNPPTSSSCRTTSPSSLLHSKHIVLLQHLQPSNQLLLPYHLSQLPTALKTYCPSAAPPTLQPAPPAVPPLPTLHSAPIPASFSAKRN